MFAVKDLITLLLMLIFGILMLALMAIVAILVFASIITTAVLDKIKDNISSTANVG
ncbi:hypothetical protein [Photobacterium kishitanii]|uniref:hypothetical protein n=1 Tax=Photobacterium kishitanii TaxID=318456 RepID=UPI0015E71367|nr:hypothetical protein [Photobacterium kishitanii]